MARWAWSKVQKRKSSRAALITGFEPFGGYRDNPSGEIARRLDGATIAGVAVVGRVLPVDIARIDAALRGIFAEVDPVAVILLGLAPGETVIRLERVALNLADFAIADNAGARVADTPLDRAGGPALWSRLPLRAIQEKLLALGIPARLSESAGTYLCNAAFYRALSHLPERVPCGFIHLPLLPTQVAATIARSGLGEPLASMALPIQRRAVETALAVSLDSRVLARAHKRVRKPRKSGRARA
jgi:pyroglutamyl-peptidase